MLSKPATYKKAIVAAVTGLVGSLTSALSDGDVTVPELIVAVLTAVIAGLGTYQIPNSEVSE